jgi:hypothetical protein
MIFEDYEADSSLSIGRIAERIGREFCMETFDSYFTPFFTSLSLHSQNIISRLQLGLSISIIISSITHSKPVIRLPLNSKKQNK